MFFESDFELRTKESHDEDLAGLESGKQVHVRGVKTLHCQSSLNRSFIFHSTKNKTFGGMHVLLEGVVPYETSCVLLIFINVLKIMTLDELNKRMRDYPISTIPPVDGGISRDRSNIIGNWSKNCLLVHRPRSPDHLWTVDSYRGLYSKFMFNTWPNDFGSNCNRFYPLKGGAKNDDHLLVSSGKFWKLF